MEWFLVGAGLFAVCGAVFDWEFFMRLFGRRGTRIFYGILGTGLVVMGVFLATVAPR